MTTLDHFGELRSLLHRAPDEEGWYALCAALEAAYAADPARYEDQLSAYVEGALATWPDAMRLAPARWYVERTSPLLGHARTLRLTKKLSSEQGARLLADPALDTLRVLHVPLGSLHGPPPLHGQLIPALTRAAPRLVELDAALSLGTEPQIEPLRRIASAPTLRRLRLHSAPFEQRQRLQHLVDAPFAALRVLELDGCGLRKEAPGVIGQADWTRDLEVLALEHCGCGTGVRPLLRRIERLRALRLGYSMLDEHTLTRMLGEHALAELEALDLSGNPLPHGGARELLAAPCMSTLRTLDLGGLHMRPAIGKLVGVAVALRSLTLTRAEISDACDEPLAALVAQLTDLTLNSVRGDWLQRTLSACFHERMESLVLHHRDAWREQIPDALPALRVLDMSSGSQGAGLMDSSSGRRGRSLLERLCEVALPALETLRLYHNELGTLAPLATASLPALRALDVSNNRMADAAGWDALPRGLTSLKAVGCSMGARQVAALAAAPPPGLRYLDLSQNTLWDNGARPLITASLPDLRELDLTSASLSLNLVRELLAAPTLPRLRWLGVARNAFASNDRAALALVEQARERGVELVVA